MQFRPSLLALISTAALFPTIATAQSHLRGGGFITDFQNCEQYGWQSGDIVRLMARARPAGVGGNDTTLRVSLFSGSYAYHLRFDSAVGGLPSEQWIDADAVSYIGSGSGFHYLPSGSVPTPRIYINTLPDYLEDDLSRMVVNGQIENFDYLPGCSAFVGLVLSYTE